MQPLYIYIRALLTGRTRNERQSIPPHTFAGAHTLIGRWPQTHILCVCGSELDWWTNSQCVCGRPVCSVEFRVFNAPTPNLYATNNDTCAHGVICVWRNPFPATRCAHHQNGVRTSVIIIISFPYVQPILHRRTLVDVHAKCQHNGVLERVGHRVYLNYEFATPPVVDIRSGRITLHSINQINSSKLMTKPT